MTKDACPCLKLMVVLMVLAGVAMPVAAEDKPAETALKPIPMQYTSFRGEELSLYAWLGERVAFLTASDELDPKVMARLCRAFDKVYDYYADATGTTPRQLPRTTFQGRSTVAEVSNTCGAGCGYLNAQGIELMPGAFRELYNGVRDHDQYDQVLFYEFGRNYWFYERQIEYKHADRTGSITTGYAVFMRFMAAEAAGVKGGPFRNEPWEKFRNEVERMVDYYMDDPDLNWDNTLRVGRAPNNPMGLGATDLFAGFLMKLYNEHGGLPFIKRLWHEAGKRPAAETTQEAVDNLVIAASIAAGKDLSQQFITWRWPVSDQARAEARRAAQAAAAP